MPASPTALLLDRFDCRALMLCGVAGGLDPALGVGDVVIGTSHIQHDYGTQREDSFHTIQPGSRPSLGRRLEARLPRGRTAGGAAARGGRRASRWSRCRRRSASAGATPSVHFGADPDRRQLRQFRDARGSACTASSRRTAVEMEGGAVAQVARRWGEDIPFVNVRCLSDLAGAESHLDFRAFLPVAARYASQVAHRLAPVI